jgi:hypothetical protein
MNKKDKIEARKLKITILDEEYLSLVQINLVHIILMRANFFTNKILTRNRA